MSAWFLSGLGVARIVEDLFRLLGFPGGSPVV